MTTRALPRTSVLFKATVVLLSLLGALLFGVANSPSAKAGGGYPYDNQSMNSISPYTYYYKNCTDYVAYRLAANGVAPSVYSNLGNANQWPANAQAKGVPYNSTPAVGAAAIKMTGTYGHVAYVEAVYSDGRIKVSEYNNADSNGNGVYGDDGTYGERTGTPAALGFVGFLHFRDITDLPTSSRVVFLDGSGNLYAKGGAINAPWILIDTSVIDYQVSPNRIAILESGGKLVVKEGGLGSPLVEVYTGISPGTFRVTDTDLLVNSNGNLHNKHGALNSVPYLVDTTVVDFQVSPNRVAILEASGQLVAGTLGTALTPVYTGISAGTFLITDTDLLVNSNGNLHNKHGALNSVPYLVDTTVVDFRVSAGRVAILEASGKLVAGTLGSALTEITTGVSAGTFDITDGRLGLNAQGTIAVKEGALNATWTTVTTGATSFRLT